jgi:hypothetical protein
MKNAMCNLFPTEFIRQSVETYTKAHGNAPKILVISNEDYYDWTVSATIAAIKQFNLEVVTGDYLKSGEIDLAIDIK